MSAAPTDSASRASSTGSLAASSAAPGRHLVDRILGSGSAGAQAIEAHAPDHGRQQPADVLDLAGVGSSQPQPRLLHRVLGLGMRSEHAVGERVETRPALLEFRVSASRHPSKTPSRELRVTRDVVRDAADVTEWLGIVFEPARETHRTTPETGR